MGDILLLLADAIIAFMVGRSVERKQNRQSSLSLRASNLRDLVRETSDDAQSYYSSAIGDRERQCATVLINSKIRRISNDLSRLADVVGALNTSCWESWMDFYRAVTGEPFASERFEPVAPNDQRILSIQDTENKLVSEIEEIEEGG